MLKPKILATPTWDYKNEKYSLVFYICVAESKADKWYRWIKWFVISLVVGVILVLAGKYLRKKYKERNESTLEKLAKNLKDKITGKKKGWFS